MDKNTVILCQNINTVINKRNIFKNLDEQYMTGILLDSEIMNLFWALKSFYTYYFRAIRYLYRQEGRKIHTPKQLFEEAKKDGKISVGDSWLLYIEYMNVFFNLEDEQEKTKLAKEIIEKFRSCVYKSCDEFCNPERQEIFDKSVNLIIKSYKEDFELDNSKPIYEAKEIGITERSYEIIMRTFRANPSIKNVWMHGSRAYGTSTYASDIDLIIDCLEEDYKGIINQLNDLSVPYFFDCKFLYDKQFYDYIKTIQLLGTKRIYCSNDFKT